MKVPVVSGGQAECEPLLLLRVIAKKIILSGQVQGVGFRPFVYRLANQHKITGWVRNRMGVVEIHAQGATERVESFYIDLITQAPAIAKPVLQSKQDISPGTYSRFDIIESSTQGEARISVPVDLFTCNDCLTELLDPADRRYRYPFINCTQCGPRYTLIQKMPYDRPNTTMAEFELCASCYAEYTNPNDRRFHAEPIACPVCGPQLQFKSGTGEVTTDNVAALDQTIAALHYGKVIAVKGIGGYHLMCDAGSALAVSKLRRNKPRPDKPLAVMFPSSVTDPFAYLDDVVSLSVADKAFLSAPARPILLAPMKSYDGLSCQIAPGLSELGVMLPYSPLHHLLLNEFGGPLVATSANISGEPVLTSNTDVEQRLAHVTEGFLHNNRPIERPADDSVFRPIAGKHRPLRLGRGYSPVEFTLPFILDEPVLAVGTQMKNTITLAWGDRAVMSPHIGEMDSVRSLQIFEQTIDDLQQLYGVEIKQIICDAHPGYTSTRWAGNQGLPVHKVFHHHAHAAACYHESKSDQPMLVFTWDGVGLGCDETLWGGEALLGAPGDWQRVASIRSFNLPGGEKAGREPWRSAAALCWEVGMETPERLDIDPLVKAAWQSKLNSPETSSVGRLFDVAAALTGICPKASFEGQGPMQLEAISEKPVDPVILLLLNEAGVWKTDWSPLLPVLMDQSKSVADRAAIFHATMAQVILQQSRQLRDERGVEAIGFSGGVFQNKLLTEHALELLQADGFEVFLPELIPVNDAGISLGQIIEYGCMSTV